jgi:3-hydroxyanthranilate 3,4-dioxygenase
MSVAAPFNFKKWIEENRHLLKPPVGNQVIYKGNEDFIVMVVGGPNARKDFHWNEGEELFYQIEGTITLNIKEDGKNRAITLNEGDIFLLPPRTPHQPVRGANTIGLVLERYRKSNELDGFMWYCENCGEELYKIFIPVSDIVEQLPQVMNQFYDSTLLTTCKQCGSVMERP